MSPRISIIQDTAAGFAAKNPILRGGEMGIETDTTLYKFGDGNTSWNSLAYQPNTLRFSAGSASAASITTVGDTDTGIYFPAANQVGITTGASPALLLSGGAVSNPTFTGVASFPDGSASAPSITNTGDTDTGLAFPADNTVAITTGGTERVRVGSTGNVGIGTTTPDAPLHVAANTANGHVVIQMPGNNTTSPRIFFRKSRGSVAIPTTVNNGDSTGTVYFYGYDGTAFTDAARISTLVDGTVDTGDVPGAIQMLTRPSGGSITERMRLDSNGLITGTGTSLGAWTSYTPTLGGTDWAIGNGTIAGVYCQIGKVVFVRFGIQFGSTSTFGASAAPTISLPVTSRNAGYLNVRAGVRFLDASLSAAYAAVMQIPTNSTTGTFQIVGTDGVLSNPTATAPFTWTNLDVINGIVTYEAA
jgi:hypothetical protein